MARSVSVPSDALLVAYAAPEGESQDDWDYGIEYLNDSLKNAFPSLFDCEYSVGREDNASLRNGLVRFGVSEYCGLVSIWAVAYDDDKEALAQNWANKIEDKFNKIVADAFGGRLSCAGRFSNGEAIFNAVPPDENKGALGLGYSSKEGWI